MDKVTFDDCAINRANKRRMELEDKAVIARKREGMKGIKILFEKHLCPREFGSAVFNVPDLLKWAQKKGFHLPTVPPLDDYDFAQAEYVLTLIANSPCHTSTTDEAEAHLKTKPELAQHPTAESAPVFLVGADAGEQWRGVLSKAIANGELVLLDRHSLLPVEPAAIPAANGEAETDAKKSNKKPPLQQQFQEQEILRVIGELGIDPKKLPKIEPGKPGIKAKVRQALKFSAKVFDKAWERLRANQDIRSAE